MASILTHAIIENAKGAVDSYISTANGLSGELQTIINTLTGSNFKGDASVGYLEFYNSKVVPALTQNLTETSGIMPSIKNMLDSIEQQLLNTVDPQLGDNNKNPGAAG